MTEEKCMSVCIYIKIYCDVNIGICNYMQKVADKRIGKRAKSPLFIVRSLLITLQHESRNRRIWTHGVDSQKKYLKS